MLHFYIDHWTQEGRILKQLRRLGGGGRDGNRRSFREAIH